MENPSSTHSFKTESIRRRRAAGECIAPWKIRKGCKIPCEIFVAYELVPALFFVFDLYAVIFIFARIVPYVIVANSYSFVILLGFGQYLSPKLHCKQETFGSLIKFLGGKLSAVPALSHFISFYFHFLTSQTPFEDDNLEDEWLETFPS